MIPKCRWCLSRIWPWQRRRTFYWGGQIALHYHSRCTLLGDRRAGY